MFERLYPKRRPLKLAGGVPSKLKSLRAAPLAKKIRLYARE